jgi:hypothetical protein
MDIYAQIVEKIIAQQEAIIGPIAAEQANEVQGLSVDWSSHQISFTSDPAQTIDELVEQYKELFGQIAVETCKEAAAPLLTQVEPDHFPNTLR